MATRLAALGWETGDAKKRLGTLSALPAEETRPGSFDTQTRRAAWKRNGSMSDDADFHCLLLLAGRAYY
ncbi:hypothetical protein ACHAQJ_009661, partial [Trichoderma viride]